MPAAVYRGDRTVVVEEVPVPAVGPRQVLMQVSHCGICGSDLHLMMEDWGSPGMRGGHEFSGVVVEVGTDVHGWSPGDRVVGGPAPGCGAAMLAEGRLPVDDLIEPGDVPLGGLQQAMERLVAGELAGKALVAPDA